jgi:hypothetical protein
VGGRSVAHGALSIAEQYVDRQSRTEVFRGRQIEVVTGRVVLHALDHRGQPLCGHDKDHMTDAGRLWSASYLPHLPRCHDCASRAPGDTAPAAAAAAAAADLGTAAGAEPAISVDIRSAHGTSSENEAAAALRTVLAAHDVRRWLFTDPITIDETLGGAVSHPLTTSPGRRWPDPPLLSDGGATDATSTWLHLSVCALEYFSLSELIGPAAAASELRQHRGYSWIYGHILTSTDWFSEFLDRHGLKAPAHPPHPRRLVGEPPWVRGQ